MREEEKNCKNVLLYNINNLSMVLEILISKFSYFLKMMCRNTFPEPQTDSASYGPCQTFMVNELDGVTQLIADPPTICVFLRCLPWLFCLYCLFVLYDWGITLALSKNFTASLTTWAVRSQMCPVVLEFVVFVLSVFFFKLWGWFFPKN